MHQESLAFLKSLKRNNNREWFHAHDAAYRNAKADFTELVTEVAHRLGQVDESLSSVDPAKSLFRINRDIRFSKNKSPYKTNLGAFLSAGGRKGPHAGYYIHVEPGGGMVAGGCWMPEADVLSRIRQEIDYQSDEWLSIVRSASFRKVFGEMDRDLVLARPPKGYESDHGALEWLKLKSFTASCAVHDSVWLDKKAAGRIARQLEVLVPLVRFLNRAVVA